MTYIAEVDKHDANAMYLSVPREAIRRLDNFCLDGRPIAKRFLLALD